MQILFGRSLHPSSLLIRLFTRSRYSHVAIVIDKGMVLEATAKDGVTLCLLSDFKRRYSQIEFATIDGDFEVGMKQLGKKYDWLSVVGIFFRKNWNNNNRWFCSELIAECSDVFRRNRISRVTPEHIYMVSK